MNPFDHISIERKKEESVKCSQEQSKLATTITNLNYRGATSLAANA